MSKSYQNALFWSLELLIIAALIWVCNQIDFIFTPLLIFVSVVITPLIISLFLYYMLSPIFRLLMKVKIHKWKMTRGIASLIVVLAMILIVVGGVSALIPSVMNELNQVIHWLPQAAKESQKMIQEISEHPWVRKLHLSTYYSQINDQVSKYTQHIITGITASAGTIIGTITSTIIVAITVPVMLFYMFKDGNRLVPSVQKLFPKSSQAEVGELLQKMSKTLSAYISGQAIECLFVAVATSIGYLIIGQPLAVVLGVVAGMANIIPYVGPYIGITPSLMVSIAVAPEKILWVIIVVVIVQQIDGNIIYPNIIGKTLQIHPLTIIMLLLAAGNIAGIPGMILCIPCYAVVKTVVTYLISIYHLRKNRVSNE